MKQNVKFNCGEKPALALLISLFLAFMLVSPAAAVNWDISPENPSQGDTLVISGTEDPNKEINVQVSFGKEVFVSNGKYEYEIDEVIIPSGKGNLFTVRAEGVNDLKVRVKRLIWLPDLRADASNGVATISQGHVPSGTYRVLIAGDAQSGKSSVDLKITASQTIEADSDGEFKYSYKTSSLPAGDFNIKVGGTSKTITLKARSNSGSSGSGSSSRPVIRPDTEIPEPTPAVNDTENEALEKGTSGEGTDEGTQPEDTSNVEIIPVEENNSGEGTGSKPEPARSPAIGVFGIICILIIYSKMKKD